MIYLLIEGRDEYDSYHEVVIGVFSNKDKAEEVKDFLNEKQAILMEAFAKIKNELNLEDYECLDYQELNDKSKVDSILEPYDEGVLYRLQTIDGSIVVSDIQLYLDLISYKERGEEAAKFLYEQRISKSW